MKGVLVSIFLAYCSSPIRNSFISSQGAFAMTGRLLFAHRQAERRHGARWLSHATATASDLIMKKKPPTKYLPVSLRLCLVGSAFLTSVFGFSVNWSGVGHQG